MRGRSKDGQARRKQGGSREEAEAKHKASGKQGRANDEASEATRARPAEVITGSAWAAITLTA